jgi:hypothetical protein
LDQIAKGDYANVIEPNLGLLAAPDEKSDRSVIEIKNGASEASGFLPIGQDILKTMSRGINMTSDLEKAMRWAHEANIQRYRKILSTPLTETERQFIQNRITEEQRAIEQFGSERGLKVAATGDSV